MDKTKKIVYDVVAKNPKGPYMKSQKEAIKEYMKPILKDRFDLVEQTKNSKKAAEELNEAKKTLAKMKKTVESLAKENEELKSENKQLHNNIDELTQSQVEMDFEQITNKNLTIEETNKLVSDFSKKVELNTTIDELIKSDKIKNKIKEALPKILNMKISELPQSTKSDFYMYLIGQALGQDVKLVISHGKATALHDMSMHLLASDAYERCCYQFDFGKDNDFFISAGENLNTIMQDHIGTYLNCDKDNVKIVEVNRSKGFIKYELISGTNEQKDKLVSLEFKEYMKEKTKNALKAVNLTPYLTMLKLTIDQIDPSHDIDYRNANNEPDMRGGFKYFYPIGWQGIALNIKGKYGADNEWLGCTKKYLPEWAVAYHGLRTPGSSVSGIVGDGFRGGAGQAYRNVIDIRTNTPCGEGSYFTPHIEVAEAYCYQINIPLSSTNKNFKVAFQCRIYPKAIRIPSKTSDIPEHEYDPDWVNDYWVINSSKDARPYRILFKEVN